MEKYWYQKQLRILETVLREPDVIGYDAQAVVAYMEQIRANCLVVNGGGVVDFFRHYLPTANPNPFMTDEDILRDVCAACHARGIKVMARVDFRGVDRKIYELHPDWFAADADGKPILWPDEATPEPLYVACHNSSYANELAVQFINALFEKYDLDGIYEEALSCPAVCHCRRCTTRYRAETGQDLPRSFEMENRDLGSYPETEYERWERSCAEERQQNLRAAVKKHGVDKAYAAEPHDSVSSATALDFVVETYRRASLESLAEPVAGRVAGRLLVLRDISEEKSMERFRDVITQMLIHDLRSPLGSVITSLRYIQDRMAENDYQRLDRVLEIAINSSENQMRMIESLLEIAKLETGRVPVNMSSGALLKFTTARVGEKSSVLKFGTNEASWDTQSYVAAPPAETRAVLWQAISGGGSLWNRSFGGQHPGEAHGKRNALLCQDAFTYMAQHEEKLIGQVPVAEAEVFRLHYPTRYDRLMEVLLDEHIQYAVRSLADLTPDGLKHTRLMLLPGAVSLSDAQCETIRQFVREGGRLLATGRTSLFDEYGQKRQDFGLRDVFGCTFTGLIKEAGYQRIQSDHVVTRNLEDTELLAGPNDHLLVRLLPESEAVAPIMFVPRIESHIPERAWLRTLKTDYPSVVVNNYGKGKCVYFAYPIDGFWLHSDHPDFSALLANALHFLLGPERRVTTNAPLSVQVTLNRLADRPNCYVLHAVNLTSAPRRPIRQVVPVSDLDFFPVLDGRSIKAFQVLYGDEKIEMAGEEKLIDNQVLLRVRVPRLEEYMAVWIEAGP